MKATGIVRRIDDLGRVVIPKEMRRTLKIHEGSPLEIFTGPDGSVVFKKFSQIGEIKDFAQMYAQALYTSFGLSCIITDTEKVVACAPSIKKELQDKAISERLMNLINERKSVSGEFPVQVCHGLENKSSQIEPIIASGDVMGSVAVMKSEKEVNSTDILKFVAQVMANQG